MQDKVRESVSVKDFGAAGDGVKVTATVSIASGSGALTATGAAFTAADVGKTIVIPGAGAAGAELITTIATAISIGPSPFEYTAGPSGEDVFIIGGTVLGININGVVAYGSVTNVTVPLEPNGTLTIAYSVAPTMNGVQR
jgi:hypothetical protein